MTNGRCDERSYRKLMRTLRDEGPGRLLSKALRYPFKPLLVPRASRALQDAAADRPEVEAWVELVRQFNYAGITVESWQIPSEIVESFDFSRPSRRIACSRSAPRGEARSFS